MAFYQDKYVMTGSVRVLWDGITRPDTLEDGTKKYTLKVAIPDTSKELGELKSIADKALSQDSKFNGNLPSGGIWPISNSKPGEFGGMIDGCSVFNTSTYYIPEVFDINGAKLEPMQYSSMLYPGSTVKLLVCAKTFDNKSRGVKFELQGVGIVDSNSPKFPVGESVNVASAFQPSQAVSTPPPIQPAHDFLTVDGNQYTRQQLIDAGWSNEQIASYQ